ncbi:MAG: lamin tail domain-containing protein [Cyclobacteriaceae bacterium]
MKKIYLAAVLSLGVLVSYGQVIITELADPNDNSNARYVELYNLGSSAVDLSTWKINRYTNGNAEPQTPVSLTGSIAAGGFYIIAASTSDFNGTYGFDPDQDIGTGGPADSNGDDIIFIINGSDAVVDIFGTPGTDGSNTCGEFEDGRAERKPTVTAGNATFTESEWNVWSDGSSASGCTSHTANDPKNAIDMDPKTWVGQPATSNPEPTNHVASFTATATSAAQIDLSWLDNDGAQAAAGFLILASTGTITAPIDFTEVATDADLSDGSAAVNIGKGIQSYSFTGLTPATTYNFNIYPYSNNSTTIDYKIDGTVPTQSTATAASKYNIGDIIISEIMYNSPGSDEEWIEIYNASGSSILLDSDWKLINTNPNYTYTFDGTVTIATAQYLTIQLGTSGSFPFSASIVFNNSDANQLNNASSTITLTAEDVAIDEVGYNDNNDGRTDGDGPSYEIIDLTADNSSTSSNWQASVSDTGSPGAASAVTVWTGATDTEWGTASNWSNGLPSTSLNAVIPDVSGASNNAASITGSTSVNDLNIASGVTVTISSAASLIINDRATGSGQVTVNKNTTHSTTAGKYSIVGSPVTSAMTSSLGSIVYKYDESIAYGTNGNARFTEVTTAESMTAGDAYFSANTGAISFTGTPNTGTVSQSLVYDETADGSAANAGFNLVSNPYTAAIDVDKLVAGNSANISASIYLWQDESSNTTRGSNDDYVVYNSTTDLSTRTTSGGKTFDGFVRSTQGFFVKATSAATLNFTASMMDAGNNSDAGFFREANENKNFLRLSLNHNESYSDIIVLLNDNAESGVDRLYDAYKVGGNNMSLYSFIDNDKFAIQGLPLSSSDVNVGLGFDVEKQGTYTLNFEEGTFEGRTVYLLDKALDKKVNLSETKSYTFTSSKVTSSDRFELVFSATESLTIDDRELANLSIFTDASSLNVRTAEAYDKVNIRVMSLNGAVALEARNVDLSSKAWSAPFNKNGFFIIAIETKDGLLIKKFLN